MSDFELWVCVVGDGADERVIYDGDDRFDLEQAIRDNEDEVWEDPEKYFLLNASTLTNGYQFYSYRGFEEFAPFIYRD